MCRLPFLVSLGCNSLPRSLPLRACPHPRGEILGGSEGRRLGTHFGNDLLRRIHPETGDLGPPLDCIQMLPEQTCHLLVQLADPLLDQLQLFERHLHQPAVDRVELRARTPCIALQSVSLDLSVTR